MKNRFLFVVAIFIWQVFSSTCNASTIPESELQKMHEEVMGAYQHSVYSLMVKKIDEYSPAVEKTLAGNLGDAALPILGQWYVLYHKYQADPQKRESLFTRALTTFEIHNDKDQDYAVRRGLLFVLSRAFRDQEKLDHAESILIRTLGLTRNTDMNTTANLPLFMELAGVYLQKKQFKQAEEYWLKSRSIAQSDVIKNHSAWRQVGICLGELKKIYQATGQKEKLQDVEKQITKVPPECLDDPSKNEARSFLLRGTC